jgi:hypothetical protein
MKRLFTLLICAAIMLNTAACLTIGPANDPIAEYHSNLTRGTTIIAGLKRYQQDHGYFPERLSALTPRYMPVIPKTAQRSGFSYKVPAPEGFDLCFPYKRKGLCCYRPGWDFWDCSAGIPIE